MKNILLLLSLFFLLGCLHPKKHKRELQPYVDFLNKDHQKAKDYILNLFKKNDIVILGERDHRENTQYEFIKELISDPRFIENVGVVFTEIGMRNQNSEINDFLHSSGLSNTEKKSKIIEFQRKCSFHPLWDKYNFYFLLDNIYEINQNLAPSKKIILFPTDIELNLDSLNVNYLKKFWYNDVRNRDSLMADYFIKNFEKIKKSKAIRKKALIIMNYRHGFNNKFKKSNGKNFDNVGRFLFDKYSGNIANVLINPMGINKTKSDVDISWRPLQGGKWDAAFKINNKYNVGFNFDSSPFGEDLFDYWTFTPHNYKYQDIYTGFVYYKSPVDFKLITGVDNLIDSKFIKSYKNRVHLWKEVIGNRLDPYYTTDSLIYKNYSKKNIYKKENIDSVKYQINKWLVK